MLNRLGLSVLRMWMSEHPSDSEGRFIVGVQMEAARLLCGLVLGSAHYSDMKGLNQPVLLGC